MRTLFFLVLLLLAAAEPVGKIAELFAPGLRRVAARRTALEQELGTLGTPVVGQTVEQFGYQHPRLSAPPLNPAWVQIDLGAEVPIDWVALVPAQLDWQSFDRPAYGFPRRFRIDLAREPVFASSSVVADFTESDFPDPGVAPVAVHLPAPETARYLRVTVTKFALEDDRYFFALSEILALSGNRNLAIGQPVTVSGRYELAPRWSAANLVDGRTPLGPPIRRELIAYDGLFTSAPAEDGPAFMQLDLGVPRELQELRLHPVHARIGADVPGFLFPKHFRIEVSNDASFLQPELVLEARDFPNPGNNPLTLPIAARVARFVRILFLPEGATPAHRFGLSEFEVYAGGENIAPAATVSRSPDLSPFSSGWPTSILNDGFSSYGRIVELPAWLESWSRRSAIARELAALATGERTERAAASRRATRALALAAVLVAAAFARFVLRGRRQRRAEIEQLRIRLARDLHDEIGSNLASLAVTGEIAATTASPSQREDWDEVQRVSRESMESMREVLWVLGAREEAGLDFATRLERTAQRMLARQEIVWTAPTADSPRLNSATRRELFLFYKEALANVARHAHARRVELRAAPDAQRFLLEISDDGRGFEPATTAPGLGLKSLHERARTLRARLTLDSAPGRGTRIALSVPL